MPTPHPRRSRLTAVAATLLTASALVLSTTLLAAPTAQADNDSTLTVAGTSDVFDSNLVQSVIKPGFEAANPGITLNYNSGSTGAAIAAARQGTASAIIVHAASVENQLVADGFSREAFGRAIFWGDYILAGPPSDPAGVSGAGTHDIARAFEKIAAAGELGNATFFSRAGTPGTTVQEHAIWALTTGVTKCDVSATNGGGQSPSTTTGACPSTISYPSWYRSSQLTQGPNVTAANTCNVTSGGPNSCYVFTDRGTFDYLQSTNMVPNLQILTRDNAASARGGVPLLVNSFHAYGVNAAKFAGNSNVAINTAGADKFLSYLTSPAAQTAVGNYLNGSDDAPFHPSAAPALTSTPVPAGVKLKSPFSINGFVRNVVPGTPALGGVPVDLMAVPARYPSSAPVKVASTTTGALGGFILKYTPLQTQTYTVRTGVISKIEVPSLNPAFGDLLVGNALAVGTTTAPSHLVIDRIAKRPRSVRLRGTFDPRSIGPDGRVYLVGSRVGQPLQILQTRYPAAGSVHFDYSFAFPRGTWRYQLQYTNSNVMLPSSTILRRAGFR